MVGLLMIDYVCQGCGGWGQSPECAQCGGTDTRPAGEDPAAGASPTGA
jgi:hypothetical protein